jgi:hypothetical protein
MNTAVGDRASVDQQWLRECHGFRVESPAGTLGVVQDVLADDDGPVRALHVTAGLFRGRTLLIDARDVARIYPWERSLRLRGCPTILAEHRGDDRLDDRR